MAEQRSIPDYWASDDVFRVLIEHMQDGVFVIQDGRLVFVNDAFAEMTGFGVDDCRGLTVEGFIAPEDRELVMSRYRERASGGNPPEKYAFNLLHADGVTRIPVMMSVGAIRSGPGKGAVVGTLKDVSELQDTLLKLRRSEAEFRAIVENSPDVFYRTDAHGVITLMSPIAEKILGYPLDELVGRKMTDLYVNPEDRDKILKAFSEAHGGIVSVESKLRAKDGRVVWAQTNAYMRYDEDGNVLGVEGIARDNTARKEMEERLRYLAGHDQLTDLPNRSEFMRRLDHGLARAKRDDTALALLFIDLDGFKQVNDRHGHDAGDQVLRIVAGRLKSHLREADTAARLGGDEFCLLLEGQIDHDGARFVAEKIISALGQPVSLGHMVADLSASVGIAIHPGDADDADTLLRCADDAMYEAKRAGKNRFGFWQSGGPHHVRHSHDTSERA